MINFPSPHDHVLPHKIKVTFPDTLSVKENTLNRVIGSLTGLAIGDALGASVEFRSRDYLLHHPVTDMQKGGTWGLHAGQWTDDTSMALCLASSLITKRCFNPYDQMVRYKWWYLHGFLSSTGHCFDIGDATRRALDEFSRRQRLLKTIFNCKNEEELDLLSLEQVSAVKDFSINCSSAGVAGNGALMRLAPLPLFFFRSPKDAIRYAGLSAILTHGDKIAADACRYYAALITAAVLGESKDKLLSNTFYIDHRSWFESDDLHPEISKVANGSYKRPSGYDDGIRGKGYIVNSLEAALWAFNYDENSFKKGVLAAIQLGDDTDTTAAIYGQLAGAYYGFSKIPEHWRQKLYAFPLIHSIGHWLYYLGEQKTEKIIVPKFQRMPLGVTASFQDIIQRNTSSVGSSNSYSQAPWSYTMPNQPIVRQNNTYGSQNLSKTVYDTGLGKHSFDAIPTAGLPSDHKASKLFNFIMRSNDRIKRTDR